MPDPTGANLTDAEVSRMDKSDPLFREFSLADRIQELRTDYETGEHNSVVVLALSGGDHTLTAPGDSAGEAETEITSSIIFVSNTTGSASTLILPDPAKYIGILDIVYTATAGGALTLKRAGSGHTLTASRRYKTISTGEKWYTHDSVEAVADMTA